MDLMVFYVDDDGAQCHVVVEIKNTDWNAIPRSRVVRTLGTQRRQVYGYLEPLEYRARRNEIGRLQAILVYPTRPENAEKDQSILSYLSDYSIQFEYTDELLQEAVADNQPEGSKKPTLLSYLCKHVASKTLPVEGHFLIYFGRSETRSPAPEPR